MPCASMQVAARIHRDDHIAASARFDLSLAGQSRPLFALVLCVFVCVCLCVCVCV